MDVLRQPGRPPDARRQQPLPHRHGPARRPDRQRRRRPPDRLGMANTRICLGRPGRLGHPPHRPWCRDLAGPAGPGGDDGDGTRDFRVDGRAGDPSEGAEDRPVGDAAAVVRRGHPVHGSVGPPECRHRSQGQRSARRRLARPRRRNRLRDEQRGDGRCGRRSHRNAARGGRSRCRSAFKHRYVRCGRDATKVCPRGDSDT
jgi:hypothetical protein